MRINLKPVGELSGDERAALATLSAAVYPPDVAATWPGQVLEWAGPQWSVVAWADDGRAVCHVGVVARDAAHDRRAVRVGGVGGVKTHPADRGRGHAAAALRRALDFLRDEAGGAFGLLVCEPALVGFYARLGWREFPGTLLVRQHGATVPFTFNRPMTVPLRDEPLADGVIDLLGPPW